MRTIPEKLRQAIAADPFMATCVHTGNTQVVWDHAFEYARRQVNERWALIPCEPQFNDNKQGKVKRFHQFIGLWRLNTAVPEYCAAQIEKYPKFDFWANFHALCLEFSIDEHFALYQRIQKYRIME